MAEKILERNNSVLIPIPRQVVKDVGLRSGNYVEVTDDGYHIIVTPVAEAFTEEEWSKLRKLASTKGKTHKTPEGVEQHLQKLKK